MNDKYMPDVDEFSDVVDDIVATAAIVVGCEVDESRMYGCPNWEQFCILVNNGLQLEGTVQNKVIEWAREYNQGSTKESGCQD